jgi:hypothetical protein
VATMKARVAPCQRPKTPEKRSLLMWITCTPAARRPSAVVRPSSRGEERVFEPVPPTTIGKYRMSRPIASTSCAVPPVRFSIPGDKTTRVAIRARASSRAASSASLVKWRSARFMTLVRLAIEIRCPVAHVFLILHTSAQGLHHPCALWRDRTQRSLGFQGTRPVQRHRRGSQGCGDRRWSGLPSSPQRNSGISQSGTRQTA